GGGGGPFFEHEMFFDHDVSGASPAADSKQIIGSLRASGGWGNSDRLWIDFSFAVLAADHTRPHVAFTPSVDFFTPDCDRADVPIPPGGNVEGETGYACTGGGDCHLLVIDDAAAKLYEMWRADIRSSTTFYGGCLAIWDLGHTYTDSLRGDQCTSADAAGYPISPLLF